MPPKGYSKYNFTIGDTIGYNTIIKRDGCKWLCQCDCGSAPRYIEPYLILRKLKCSACGNSRLGEKNPVFKGYKDMRGNLIRKFNLINEKNGFDNTDLTMEFLWQLYLNQNKKCALSGIDIHFYHKNLNFYSNYEKTASLDRIDSAKGYFKNNVQWVHKDVNRIKNKYSMSYFLFLISKIVKHLGVSDLSKIIELEDNTDLQGELACSADGCEIR